MSTLEWIGTAAALTVIWGIQYMFWKATKKIQEWQAIRDEAMVSHRALNEAIALYNYGAKQEAIEILNKHSIPHNVTEDQ